MKVPASPVGGRLCPNNRPDPYRQTSQFLQTFSPSRELTSLASSLKVDPRGRTKNRERATRLGLFSSFRHFAGMRSCPIVR